ncbi:MAG TPA: ABC transporter substrate-binding protein [Ktedonobacteraceae bacterium]|nr:ABC transporter substrate-binding protein [Ktedonobacteraceae bacterium]
MTLNPSLVTILKTRRSMVPLSFLLILTIVVTACGGSQSHGSHVQSPLSIVANTGGDFTRNSNPYNNSLSTFWSRGLIYETLLFFNSADNSVKPWLASAYKYSSDATSVTFTLRQGVKWSDGQPFTSDDVVFTLNLLKKYPAMDYNGIDSSIKSVTAPDASTVVVTFTSPNVPILWYLGGQTWILPKHTWSTVKGDPSQFADPNPVGTGPYLFHTFTPQLVTLVKNPNFWQPGKPQVNELEFPAFDSNDSAELALDRGTVDWAGLYIPNIQQTYINRDPAHNHYWFPPSDIVVLYLNTAKYPFNLLPVRQAISSAIDREQIYKVGENGYEPPASPTGLLLPQSKKFLSPSYANMTFTVDTNKSISLLEGAGFTMGSDGIFADKSGKKLSFNIDVVTGYTDWITTCQIIASDLKAVGIKANVNTISYDAYYNALQVGNFDMGISWTNPGPSPYFLYYGLLSSQNTAPLGQAANSNWERWKDATTDNMLNILATSLDSAMQQQAYDTLQQIMVTELPSIPLVNEPYWYEYSTAHFTGWPDQKHQYAEPSPYQFPDGEIVLLNLRPVD